jgi:TolB-like protein/Flp pilus assembly protein TadD
MTTPDERSGNTGAGRDAEGRPSAGMSAERWREIQQAVDGALDLPPEARAAYLDRACGADAALRESVARLLDACERAERADGLLAAPASAFAAPVIAELAMRDAAVAAEQRAAQFDALRKALAGHYTIERELGRGGMAAVYLAHDIRHERQVAVKMVARDLVPRMGAERFLYEIRTAARLTHPHVLGVHDSGEADGLLYYVMPYIQGETLRARLAREGALPMPDALRLFRELAGALAYAHAQGVVHRDLKPENVLLSDGHAVIADFGIAKALAAATQGGTLPGSALTLDGVALGTPGYMAPEQARGDITDHRADLYALGVVAWEMFAGMHPFGARSPAARAKARQGETPASLGERRPDMPPAVAAVVMLLLADDPDARPQSAEAVLQLLDGAVADPAALSTPAGRAPARRRHPAAIGAAAGLLLVAGLLVVAGIGRYDESRAAPPQDGPPAGSSATVAAPAATRPSVAVLPFENTSGDPADEAFSDGLTDELIGALGKVPGLRVTGRTSAFALKGKGLGVRAVAETLGVGAVVEGSYRRSGRRLRIGAQLVSAADGAVLWTEMYDRELADVFTVQEELALAIAGALTGRLAAGTEPASRVDRPTGDLAAYELYLRGRAILHARNSRGAILEAMRYFEQAIARDPSFARAHAKLADANAALGALSHGRPDEEFARARAEAGRALALDSTIAEAHVALAHILFAFDFDWVASERAFRRAIALDPADVRARVLFAIPLQDQGRVSEALAQLDTARSIDPLAPIVGLVRGRVYVNAQRPAEAIRPLQEALALSPELDLAYQQLGHAQLQLGRQAEAIAAFQRSAELSGVRDSAQLAYAYAVVGRRAEAERIVQALLASSARRYIPPFHIAMAWTGLGDRDAAFGWLERGYTERGSFMDGVKVTPAFGPLHGDPRWPQLLRRMRLGP